MTHNQFPEDLSILSSIPECYLAQTNFPACGVVVSLVYLSRESLKQIEDNAPEDYQPVAIFRIRKKQNVDQLINHALLN